VQEVLRHEGEAELVNSFLPQTGAIGSFHFTVWSLYLILNVSEWIAGYVGSSSALKQSTNLSKQNIIPVVCNAGYVQVNKQIILAAIDSNSHLATRILCFLWTTVGNSRPVVTNAQGYFTIVLV
jgi:hypothetical protein